MTKIYMCPECGSTSDTKKWNEATVSKYGIAITGIEEEGRDNCSYRCPECSKIVQGDKIREVK